MITSIDISWVPGTLDLIREKMEWVSRKNQNKIPYTTDHQGNYDDRSDMTRSWPADDGLNWWTNGFWPGILWLLYRDTRADFYKDVARRCEKKLEQCFTTFYGLHHDLGFMFMPSAVTDYRLTGNKDAKRIGLIAANLLAGRFNPNGNFIRAWNDYAGDTKGWVIIDSLFNLSLLYWASEETGDPRFRAMAERHADTVRNHFIRSDGSVCHIVEFDPESGAFIRSLGGQGYKEGSSWTRGQGWAIYGFMISYRHTGKKEYLDASKKVADYCLSNIPTSGIIPIDFRQPSSPAYEDSCGACVIAGGLLELSRHLTPQEGKKYCAAAVKLIRTIAEQRADYSHQCDAIVLNCSASYHDTKHHFTMNYADYFFMETLYRLLDQTAFLW